MLDALNDETTIGVSEIGTQFGVREMLEPDKQRDRLASLLCYLGALTVGGKTADAKIILEIPNLVMRKLYAERILKMTFSTADELDEGQAAADALFCRGDIQPLCAFVEKYYFTVYDNRDYQHFNELTLKTLFLALLHHNNLYIMDSEPALQRRYGDLIMIIRPEMRHYSVHDILLEFKYVPLNKLKIGKRQLTGQDVQAKSDSELAELGAVKRKLDEARGQLRGYRQTLQQKYGQALKLRTYAVVGIGLARLIWEEVTG